MLALAVAAALIAALIHVYIFVLETLRWEAESTRRTFGTTPSEAAATKALAANQGVYNLMLAIIAFVGVALILAARQSDAGPALVLAACGTMLGAACYLIATDHSKARAAIVQGTAPLIAVFATVVWLLR
jgi:putative membrane protein